MTVRYATQDDMPRLVELAREEHARAPWAASVGEFNPRIVEMTARSFMMEGGRTLVMTDGGYLAGLMQPLGFSPACMAVEYAWFARDGSGMTLLRHFIGWAQRMGAVAVAAHDYAQTLDSRPSRARLSRVLARRGWQRMGAGFVKPLEH